MTDDPRERGIDQEERLRRLHKLVEVGVADLTAGDNWRRYLRISQRNSRLSPNNALLVAGQHPSAQLLMTMKRWNQLGYRVTKGEHGIWIYEPVKRWVTERDETTGEERRKYRMVNTRPSLRFAQDQVDGPPLDLPRPKLLTGDTPAHFWDAAWSVIGGHGYTVRIEQPIMLGANGETVPSQKVVRIAPGLSPLQKLKTALHEGAHIRLDHIADYGAYRLHRDRMECEAEGMAFVIAGALGLDTSDYSTGYLAAWSGGNLELIRETADRVVKGAQSMLHDMGLEQEPLDQLMPEPGIDLSTGIER